MEARACGGGKASAGRAWGAALVVAMAAAGLALLGGGSGSAAAQAGDPRPNVVMFLTDDQTVADLAVMPHTGLLVGDHGASFARAHASYPLCCPSRATLLTGQYAHNHGVLGNNPPLGGYYRLNQERTLPVWLQGAGYHTAHIGKLPNGYNGGPSSTEVPPGWKAPNGDFFGFLSGLGGAYFNYALNENGTFVRYREREQDYQTDIYRQKALEVIARQFDHPNPRQPLYMQLAFFAPHDPARPAPRHEGLFATTELPRGGGFDEPDLSDKPAWLQSQAAHLDAATITTITERHRNRLESLQAVDEAVQVVLDALATRGELDNTYVLFTSDNGYFQGQHRIYQGKYLPHAPSSGVPLLIRGPGIPSYGRPRELVSNVDVVPTILAATGAQPALPVDGRSLLPFAQDPDLRTRRPLLIEAGVAEGILAAAGPGARRVERPADLEQDATALAAVQKISPQPYKAVLTRRYLWVIYADGSRELYDLSRDPHQLASRHANPRYQLVRKRLNRDLRRLAGCAGAGCLRPGARTLKPLSKRRLAALRAKRRARR